MSRSKPLLLTAIGTRPEVIKMAPVIQRLQARGSFARHMLCVTGQHDQMLQQALDMFNLHPQINLKLMRPGQSLQDLLARLIPAFTKVLERQRPQAVLVHGDTISAFGCAWAAYQLKIPVAHIEAGLRTHDFYDPFPEESNRVLIDRLATWCFAPTPLAAKHLKAEGIGTKRIHVTGNTVVDALQGWLRAQTRPANQQWQDVARMGLSVLTLTMHRRESFTGGLAAVVSAVQKILAQDSDRHLFFPRHLNPHVLEATRALERHPQVTLLKPLPYFDFLSLMASSAVILSDSGGVQEEAPSLGVPVVVLRNVTERPELLKTGWARLSGTDPKQIVRDTEFFLKRRSLAHSSSRSLAVATPAKNPFGDGKAAARIYKILQHDLS